LNDCLSFVDWKLTNIRLKQRASKAGGASTDFTDYTDIDKDSSVVGDLRMLITKALPALSYLRNLRNLRM
jgi:hypothetical protein